MNKLSMLIISPVGTRSGYGAHSRDICLELIKSDKFNIQILPTPWGSCPNNALDGNDTNHRLIIDRLINQLPQTPPDIFIQITIPSEFQRLGKFNIGITAGIETTLASNKWIVGCNKMDLVLATSEHSKQILLDSIYDAVDNNKKPTGKLLQVLKPIEVLFEGIDFDLYKKTNDIDVNIATTLDAIPEDFCFLHVGQWLQGELGADRKDIGMLVKVFCDIFKMKPPKTRPALILKTSGAGFSVTDKNDILRKLEILFAEYGGKRPNVYLIHGDLTDSEMNSLYNHKKVKAMVSFTHGEGYGRPLLEFTTSKKPVIVSGWSGQLDFLHPTYSTLIPGELKAVPQSAVNDWVIKDSKWFVCDYNKAAQLMFDVYSNYDKYYENSKIQSNITANKFGLDKMQTKLIELIELYMGDKAPQYIPKQAVTQKLELPKLKRIS